MLYKGVEYTVVQVDTDVWKWQFRIGGRLKTGTTTARLNLLALRRVQLRINRELAAWRFEFDRAAE
jgi:hypothetical protein